MEVAGQTQSEPIEFSDPVLENGRTLQAVINLITGNAKIHEHQSKHIPSIVRFLQKYDMRRELEIVRLQIAEETHDKKCRSPGIRLLLAAASLGNHILLSRKSYRDGADRLGQTIRLGLPRD